MQSQLNLVDQFRRFFSQCARGLAKQRQLWKSPEPLAIFKIVLAFAVNQGSRHKRGKINQRIRSCNRVLEQRVGNAGFVPGFLLILTKGEEKESQKRRFIRNRETRKLAELSAQTLADRAIKRAIARIIAHQKLGFINFNVTEQKSVFSPLYLWMKA